MAAKAYVLNLGHRLSAKVLTALSPATVEVRVSFQLDLDSQVPTPLQTRLVVDELAEALEAAGGALDGTVPLYVALPGLSEGVALIVAELAGRLGAMPRVLALRRQADGTYDMAAMRAVVLKCRRCDGVGKLLRGAKCPRCAGTGKAGYPAIGGVIDLERVRQAARERR